MEENYKLEQLRNYYKENQLVLIGLNDFQGVNINSSFFKKGLLDHIATSLKNDEIDPIIFDAFSLTMNKTEHIDYFLKSNLSLEEIKVSKIYSAINAIRKITEDFNLPKSISKIGNIYRLLYQPKNGDEKIFLTDSIKESVNPILIYSSGVNNLMREIGNNPTSIKRDYQKRNETPNYNYTLEKVKDPNTLKLVIDSIENNFLNILKINPNTDIYTLGAYIPKIIDSEEMSIFKELILSYNEKLLQLCKSYNITYINTEEIGKMYNKSKMNFHISSTDHKALADYILSCMWDMKFNSDKSPRNYGNFITNNKGPDYIIENTNFDYVKSLISEADCISEYEAKREMEIAKEHQREKEIFEQVKENSITKRKIKEVEEQEVYSRMGDLIEELNAYKQYLQNTSSIDVEKEKTLVK